MLEGFELLADVGVVRRAHESIVWFDNGTPRFDMRDRVFERVAMAAHQMVDNHRGAATYACLTVHQYSGFGSLMPRELPDELIDALQNSLRSEPFRRRQVGNGKTRCRVPCTTRFHRRCALRR